MREISDVGTNPTATGQLWLGRFDDVVLSPAVELRDDPLGFCCAGHTRSGEPIPKFRFRRADSWAPVAPFRRPWRRTSEPHLYGGVTLGHYGHFLLESLTRLWAIRAFPRLPVAWQFFGKHKRLNKWQGEVLEIVGVDKGRVRLIHRPTLFRTLIAPDEGVLLNTIFHPDQIAALAAYQFLTPQNSKRIWLSRRLLPAHAGRVTDEGAIEERLAGLGWTIVSPEVLSIRQQLELMADAGTVGGFIGSAFHTLVLGRDVQTKVRMVRRYNDRIPEVFDLIADLKNFDQRILNVRLDALKKNDNSALDVSRLASPQELDRIIDELHD